MTKVTLHYNCNNKSTVFNNSVSPHPGRQFDGTGNAAQWWTTETIEAFTEKGTLLMQLGTI